MNHCKACGQDLPPGARFCPGCGRPAPQPPVNDSAAPTQAHGYHTGSIPPPGGGVWFVQHMLGLIPLALYALAGFALFVSSGPVAFRATNIRNMCLQTAPMLPLLVGAALTVRARGLDLSLAALFSLGAFVMATAGALPALLVTAACGLVSGALIVGLRLPSVIVSLVTAAIYSGICMLGTGAMPVMLERRTPVSSAVFFVVPLLCLAAGFLYQFLAPMGRAGQGQDRMLPNLLAYSLAGALAGVGGVLMVLRIHTYAPTMGGASYYIYLALVWAAIKSTRLADNRVVPVLYAALLAGMNTVYSTALILLGATAYFEQIVLGLAALLFFVAAGVVFVVSAYACGNPAAGIERYRERT